METSVCFISLSFYELHRHIIYQKKADFLTDLVTGRGLAQLAFIKIFEKKNFWGGKKKKEIRPTIQGKKSQSAGLQETIFYLRVAP